eukprot:6496861-Alexandrium_andersonii.AAC.1
MPLPFAPPRCCRAELAALAGRHLRVGARRCAAQIAGRTAAEGATGRRRKLAARPQLHSAVLE